MRLFSGFSGVLVFSHHTAVEYHGVLLRITCKRTVHYFLLDDSWRKESECINVQGSSVFLLLNGYCLLHNVLAVAGHQILQLPSPAPPWVSCDVSKNQVCKYRAQPPCNMRKWNRCDSCQRKGAQMWWRRRDDNLSPSSIKTVHFLRVSAVSRVILMGPSVLHPCLDTR